MVTVEGTVAAEVTLELRLITTLVGTAVGIDTEPLTVPAFSVVVGRSSHS